jgi:hypothetical protein
LADIKHVSQLKFDPKNARVHTERNVGMIADGIQEVGMGRSILIDKDGEIIAGNGVVEGAMQAGITKVRVVETTGDEIIAVQRKDLAGKKKTRAALLDNRAQEVGGGWNTDVLRELSYGDEKILDGLWGKDEVDALLAKDTVTQDDDPLTPVSQLMKGDGSGMQRLILWVEKDRYDSLMAMVRAIGGRFEEDDISKILIRAVEDTYERRE